MKPQSFLHSITLGAFVMLNMSAGAATKYFDGASGTAWDNSTANWGTASGGPYTSAWASYDNAVFQGTGTTVTLNSVIANTLTFNSNGYILTGSTLGFGNPDGTSVTVASGVTATISSTLNHPYSTGIRVNGTGTLVLNGTGNSISSSMVADNGSISITGGSTTAASLWTGDSSGTTGSLSISAGSLTITGGTTVATRGVGGLNQSGGTSTFSGGLAMGYYNLGVASTATVNLSGGNMNVNNLTVGQSNTTGCSSIFTQSGGTFTLTGGGLTVGNWGGGVQQLNVSAGIFNATAASANNTLIAIRGTASMTVSGTADVRLTDLQFGHPSTSGTNGTLNLNGGTLTCGAIGENSGTHTSTFNFNGGTLKASVGSTTYLQGLDTANVRNGGAVIDTNSQNITIGQNLVHSTIGGDNATDGGLTKTGSGTLTLSGISNFTGPTTVTAGTLALASGGMLVGGEDIVITGNPGASLSIGYGNALSGQSNLTVAANSGGVYLAEGVVQSINSLTLGGQIQPEGFYGSSTSGAPHVNDTAFSGPGRFNVIAYQPLQPGAIPYANLQPLIHGSQFIIEQAAKTLPRANQVAWQRLETTFFAHFGVNTFNGVEWGTGTENPNIFNPTAFDADQWVREIKNAGGRMLIIVAKHHDGFCLWPSRYTAHDVGSSSWMGGTGNVIRALTDACHARGIKVGLYLSPADLFQIHSSAPEGFYANGSASVPSAIPTDPAGFKTSPSTGRTPPAGFSGYTYTADDYNRYFLNELYELLTEYGTIDEMWFDGANPEPGYVETYSYADWYDLIHKLQPNAVIAVGGPDVRWVGNESGIARTDEWSVIPFTQVPGSGGGAPDATVTDLGSRAKLTAGSYLWWFPAECDVPILNGWFWSSSKTAKSASTLLAIYYTSVGRNSNLLLNLSPDTRGLIPDNQLAPLRSFGTIVRNTFAINHAAGAAVTAPPDSLQPASLLQDDNPDTFWEASATSTTADLVFDLPAARTFDLVSLQEPIASRGQRIEGFSIDTWTGSAWTTQASGTTIGYKRLMKFPAAVTTNRVRLRITGCRLNPSLAEVTFHKEAISIAAPVISERSGSSTITITGTAGLPIRYTLDGSDPSSSSPLYTSAVYLPFGGTISAASFGADGLPGIVTTKSFANVSPAGWTVIAYDSQTNATGGAATNGIDDNPSTNWQTTTTGLPQSITIDMISLRWIGGFTYLPTATGGNGTVKRYRFETSDDHNTWTIRAEGTFGNIAYNPVLQTVPFAPVSTRYFRFTALEEINGNNWVSTAELGVIPAGFDDWRRQHALQSASPDGDPDGNGLSALMEYAAVIEPGANPANPLLTCFRPSPGELRIALRHRNSLPDLEEIIESSTDLSHWQPAAGLTILTSTDNGDGSSTVERSAPIVASDDRMFYRAVFRQRQ